MTERSTLPAVWEVPQEFRDRLSSLAGRQRAMSCDGHLLLVLHAPPDPEDITRVARYFWRKPDGTWNSDEFGSGTKALGRHLDQYAERINEYDEQEERAVDAEGRFRVLELLAPVHRASRHLHQVLQEARKMCGQDRDLIGWRDRAYEIERTAELLYSEARNSLDFSIAQRAEEQTKSSYQMALSAHRLNLLAAFFFPIATLATLFGANLTHGLESVTSPIPFMGLLLTGLVAGVILTSFVTRNSSNRTTRSK